MPGSRVNNFAGPANKRKQVHSIGLAAYNSNPNVPTLSSNIGGGFSNNN